MNDAYIALPRRPTRGILCQAERQYFNCCWMNVVCYYYVDQASIVLDPSKEVQLSPRLMTVIQDPNIQSMQTGRSSNTTRSFGFILPIVSSLGLFESAACGDVPRDDEFESNTRIQESISTGSNISGTSVVSNVIHFCNYLDYEMVLSERRAAKKVPFMNHQEARRHLNMADRPAYMELPVMHWLESRRFI